MRQLKATFLDQQYTINYLNKPSDAKKAAHLLLTSAVVNFGLDTETYPLIEHKKGGLDPHLSAIRLIQLYDGEHTVYVFDTYHDGLEQFKLLNRKNYVAHYGIFEIKHLSHAGIKNLNVGCSMLMSILTDRAERSPYQPGEDEVDEEPSSWKGYGLDAVIGRLFDVRIDKKFQTYPWKEPDISSEALVYAALDSILTYKIVEKLYPKINEYKLQRAYRLLKDMQHVIADMELNGMYLNKEEHSKLIGTWEVEKNILEMDLQHFFFGVNVNSTKQLGEYVRANYPEDVVQNWPKTEKNALSFDANSLVAMKHLPGISKLLEYKKVAKLISTYGESLQSAISPITNRIHCSYSLGETRTGRLSSREPNLQNLPRSTAIRHIFCAEPGRLLVVADFNQIELRVAGEVSQDPVIRKAYMEEKDLHTIFASKMFNKRNGQAVTKEERQIAKSANFGAIYGMGPDKFKQYALKATNGEVKLTKDEAKHVIDSLWALYVGYARWCKKIRYSAEQFGFVRTPLGRMRKLLPEEVYTKAPNTVVQGGAFEVMALSMIELRKRLPAQAKIVNSVHDEVILEAPEVIVDNCKTILEECMVHGMKAVFPNATVRGLAKAKICKAWDEGK